MKKIILGMVIVILVGCSTLEKQTISVQTPTERVIASKEVINTKEVLPTLSSSLREQAINQFNQTNENCTLPCIWGIEPGVTSVNDAVNTFSYLGWRINYYEHYGFSLIGTGQEIPINVSLSFYGNNDVVENIKYTITEQYADLATFFSFKNTLKSLEEPIQIYLFLIPTDTLDINYDRVILTMYFKNSNVIWMYLGNAQVSDSIYHICPSEHLIINDLLDPLAEGLIIISGSGQYSGSPEKISKPFGVDFPLFGKPLEKVTDYTIPRFINEAKNSVGDFCFQVSIDDWLNE